MLRCLLLLIWLSLTMSAQTEIQNFKAPNDTSFFPISTGNLWQYLYSFEVPADDTVQVFVVADSLLSDSSRFYTQVARRINPIAPPPTEFYADTMGNIVNGNKIFEKRTPTSRILKLDLGKLDGTPWVSFLEGQGAFVLGRVVLSDTVDAFGRPRVSKLIEYYAAGDSSDTTGFIRSYAQLLKGIGLVYQGGGEIFSSISLTGALINNVLFGDTTNIIVGIENWDSQPNNNSIDNFSLDQNSPNPFNGQTNISFTLQQLQNVELVIHGITGKRVRVLVEATLPAGKHQISWDGYDENNLSVASGIYFYTLRVGDLFQTRKLSFIK